tara:strand:+ start:467 stop:658 length:192 start_codon:yes stop_codon:yes gene_type:complete
MTPLIDPGQAVAIAYLTITLAVGFVFGLPLLLIAGSRLQEKRQLLILSPEELAYEAEMFGFVE